MALPQADTSWLGCVAFRNKISVAIDSGSLSHFKLRYDDADGLPACALKYTLLSTPWMIYCEYSPFFCMTTDWSRSPN